MPKPELDELIAQAANTSNGDKRKGIAAKARKLVKPKVKSNSGRPSQYSEAKATAICKEVANGKTLTTVTKEMGISLDCVYGWLKNYPAFAETYQFARESMARSLLDELLDDARTTEPDKALLLKVKSGVFTWAISRFNPKDFSDSKRIELKSEVNVRHVHELPIEQRKRIAESWLASQIDDDHSGLVIEHEPETGVSIVEESEREIPRRKKSSALPAKIPTPGSDDSSNTRWRGGRHDERAS